MKFKTHILFLLTLAGLWWPAARAADPVVVVSFSKQFAVRGLRQTLKPMAGVRNANLVRVDPALLAITCERIKEVMQSELGWGDRWRGKIFIDVHPIRVDNERVTITSMLAPDGWTYQVSMADEIEPARLVRVIVGVLLTEFANRNSPGPRSAELPPWLAEGLSAHLQSGPLSGLVLEPESVTFHRRLSSDPLGPVRARLLNAKPLTVDRINWPEPEDREGEGAALYDSCAHLFVRELLRLRAGPDCLCAMLALLPEHLNWQTAFLRGYEPHFRRMLDVEKWWSLSLANFTGRTTSQTWSEAESRAKLEEILYTPVEVRLPGVEPKHSTFASLPTIIEEWEFRRQSGLLREKTYQLAALRPRMSRELADLSEAYRGTLVRYLDQLDRALRLRPSKTQEPPNPRLIVSTALQEIRALDARRDQLRGAAPPSTNGVSAVPVPSLTGR